MNEAKTDEHGNGSFNVEDRLAAINLLHSYGYLVDQQQLEDFFNQFADAPTIEFWQSDKKIVEGWEGFKETTTTRQAKFKQEKIQRRHVLTAPRFEQQSSDAMSGQVYLQLYKISGGTLSLITIGYYDFVLVKQRKQWKISRWVGHLDVLPD
jgi:SnoaL-like domain